MNKRIAYFAFLSLVLLTAAALTVVAALRPEATVQASPPSQVTTTDNAGITVSGEGRVTVKPDIATAAIGVETVAVSLSDATNQSNTKMTAVISKLKSLGIEDKDIQTVNYSVSPVTQPSPRAPEGSTPAITGYRVANQVSVKIRKLADVGSVLDAAVTAGANSIYGVSFGVADPKSLENQARTLAVKDAQEKAAQMAKDAGVTIGPIVSIAEGGGVMPVSSLGARSLAASAVPVETGELVITAFVNVRFSIK